MELLAPNGKPSNLTPEQYKLVRTPEFKAWYGDWEKAYETGNYDNVSKVIDENGEPKVKWRGDNNPKNVFDYINYGGHGVYYFGDEGFAESFGDKLNSYFINSRNPFIPNKLTTKEKKEIEDLWKNDAEIILKQSMAGQGYREGNIQDLHDYLENYYLWDKETGWFLNKDVKMSYPDYNLSLDILLFVLQGGINFYLLERKEIIDWIKNKNNYDGYISFEGNEDNIAVFNSTQIKLADGTNTTFDSNNPDIRYKNGGLTMKKPKAKLLAPNGKPSNLTPEQYRLVRTPAFKKWFGDWENSPETASKVVDENGEPLIVWHTTKKTGLSRNQTWSKGWWDYEFIFKPELEGMNMEKKRREKGAVYFTDSEELSKTFGEEDNSYTFSFFLNFVNPIILDANNQHIEFLSDEIAKSSDLDIIVRNATDTIGWNMTFSVSNIFITSYSNRIKLADGTNKKFDGSNPDVRFMSGGEITLTTEQVENKLGRKLHWWNDDVVSINGIEYKKVFLKPEYKRL